MEYGYATQNNLPVAALENKYGYYIAPTPESAARALEAVELSNNLVEFISDPEDTLVQVTGTIRALLLKPLI